MFSPVPSWGTELPEALATTDVVRADTTPTLLAVTRVAATVLLRVEVAVLVAVPSRPARVASCRSAKTWTPGIPVSRSTCQGFKCAETALMIPRSRSAGAPTAARSCRAVGTEDACTRYRAAPTESLLGSDGRRTPPIAKSTKPTGRELCLRVMHLLS